MADPPDDKPRVRDWPRIWWHDEKFWREVATRALAGLIVVFIGYMFAIATGYLQVPTVRTVIAFILCAAFILIAFVVIARFIQVDLYLTRSRKNGQRKQPRWRDELLLWGGMVLTAAITYFAVAYTSAWGGLGTLFVH